MSATYRDGRRMAEKTPGKAARVLGLLDQREGVKPRAYSDSRFQVLAERAAKGDEWAKSQADGLRTGIAEGLGQSSRCQNCGRDLTDPTSVARGIGPDCWSKGARPIGYDETAGTPTSPSEPRPDSITIDAAPVSGKDEAERLAAQALEEPLAGLAAMRAGMDSAGVKVDPTGGNIPLDLVGTSWSSLEAFYATSPYWRERSPEMDFGVWWSWDEDRRDPWRVSVLEKTGEIIAVRQGLGGKRDDYVALLGRFDPRSTVPYEAAEAALAGWPDRCKPGGLRWVVNRLAMYGARKADDATGEPRPPRITHIGRGASGPIERV